MVEQQFTLEEIQKQLQSSDITAALKWWCANFENQVTFSTSFSAEDQLIGHYIWQNKLPIRVFTLDTGRLFAETYSVWSATVEKYQVDIASYHPDTSSIEQFVTTFGPNAFYQSVELRKACCTIRKVEPLKRALQHKKVWITGLRAEHSSNRSTMPQVEWDEQHQVYKFHPLLHWSSEDIKKQIDAYQIPYNPLHNKGFVSIGCAPCTRAIQPGENFRAGRWWWEDASKKECGLHVHQ